MEGRGYSVDKYNKNTTLPQRQQPLSNIISLEMVEDVKLAANKALVKESHVQIVDSLWLIES